MLKFLYLVKISIRVKQDPQKSPTAHNINLKKVQPYFYCTWKKTKHQESPRQIILCFHLSLFIRHLSPWGTLASKHSSQTLSNPKRPLQPAGALVWLWLAQHTFSVLLVCYSMFHRNTCVHCKVFQLTRSLYWERKQSNNSVVSRLNQRSKAPSGCRFYKCKCNFLLGRSSSTKTKCNLARATL